MDADIDAVLVQRLEALGREAGRVGGGAAGAAGGAQGSAWAAKRLTTETAAEAQPFDPSTAPRVLAALSELLRAEPVPHGASPGETVAVRGVVGSGVGGLNPAYVVAVVDVAAGQVSVAAHAKEGLIKQRTAQKAVRRVIGALTESGAFRHRG